DAGTTWYWSPSTASKPWKAEPPVESPTTMMPGLRGGRVVFENDGPAIVSVGPLVSAAAGIATDGVNTGGATVVAMTAIASPPTAAGASTRIGQPRRKPRRIGRSTIAYDASVTATRIPTRASSSDAPSTP